MAKTRAVLPRSSSIGCPGQEKEWPRECDASKHKCFGVHGREGVPDRDCGLWVCGAHFDQATRKCPDCYVHMGFSIRSFMAF